MTTAAMNWVHKPKSVEDIVDEAQAIDHKSEYPLRIALRTAQNLLNQVPITHHTSISSTLLTFLTRLQTANATTMFRIRTSFFIGTPTSA